LCGFTTLQPILLLFFNIWSWRWVIMEACERGIGNESEGSIPVAWLCKLGGETGSNPEGVVLREHAVGPFDKNRSFWPGDRVAVRFDHLGASLVTCLAGQARFVGEIRQLTRLPPRLPPAQADRSRYGFSQPRLQRRWSMACPGSSSNAFRITNIRRSTARKGSGLEDIPESGHRRAWKAPVGIRARLDMARRIRRVE
jgi:hypothetical protein